MRPAPFRLDTTLEPALLIRAMDEVGRDPAVARLRAHAEAALALEPGDRLLDVGCGTADVALSLAGRVGPSGLVVGVDRSGAVVAEARRRRAAYTGDGAGRVELWEGDGTALPFPSGSFTAARCERTLQHVADPGRVVSELVRVVGSGGRVHLIDTDWETLTFNHPDRQLTRRVTTAVADHAVAHGWAGRTLVSLLRRRGVVDLQLAAETMVVTRWDPMSVLPTLIARMLAAACQAGLVTADEAATWLHELAAISARGSYFSSVTMFAVGGRRP